MGISISTARQAGAVLTKAARAADANHDGQLTTAELHAASGKNGAAATTALLTYHAQHRAMIRKDPEISDKAREMKFMPVGNIDFSVSRGVEQMGRIDAYRGNTADGVVTNAELKRYGRTGGRWQMEAGPLARFTSSFAR